LLANPSPDVSGFRRLCPGVVVRMVVTDPSLERLSRCRCSRLRKFPSVCQSAVTSSTKIQQMVLQLLHPGLNALSNGCDHINDPPGLLWVPAVSRALSSG
jgi:hypothetical protein